MSGQASGAETTLTFEKGLERTGLFERVWRKGKSTVRPSAMALNFPTLFVPLGRALTLFLLVARCGGGAVQDPVLQQELSNHTHRLEVLVEGETSVIATGNRVQLVRDSRLLQGLVKTHAVSVGHDLVGIAMNRQGRREAGSASANVTFSPN